MPYIQACEWQERFFSAVRQLAKNPILRRISSVRFILRWFGESPSNLLVKRLLDNPHNSGTILEIIRVALQGDYWKVRLVSFVNSRYEGEYLTENIWDNKKKIGYIELLSEFTLGQIRHLVDIVTLKRNREESKKEDSSSNTPFFLLYQSSVPKVFSPSSLKNQSSEPFRNYCWATEKNTIHKEKIRCFYIY